MGERVGKQRLGRVEWCELNGGSSKLTLDRSAEG